MNRCVAWGMALMLGTMTANAAWKLGASAGYTVGGDVEDNDFAPGVHATWVIDDTWAVEFGLLQFSDSGGELEEGIVWRSDIDATALSATLLAGRDLAEGLRGYVGAGAAYYALDAEGTAELTADTDADTAAWKLDADYGYGLHALAGIEWKASDALSVFADARYAVMAYDYEGTWTETFGGDVYTGTEDDTEDYIYGLLRIGLNWTLP